MADHNCFGWTLGPPENVVRGRKTSVPARKEQRKLNQYVNQSLGLQHNLQKASPPKKLVPRKSDCLEKYVPRSLRTQESRQRSNFPTPLEPRNARQPESSTIRKVFWSRFSPDAHLVESCLHHQIRLNCLCEPQILQFTGSSEQNRARRKRKKSWTTQNSGHAVERKPKLTGDRRLCSDRILDSMNDLEAKLINMSTKNGNLIFLAWSLNEEFQMIEKNVESLMGDMKSLHQDLKDLRFANDLLHLLKGELNQVSLKRWPFMILNENFCENPQQEFNLII